MSLQNKSPEIHLETRGLFRTTIRILLLLGILQYHSDPVSAVAFTGSQTYIYVGVTSVFGFFLSFFKTVFESMSRASDVKTISTSPVQLLEPQWVLSIT